MLAQGSNVAPNHWLHLSGKSLPHLGKRASLGNTYIVWEQCKGRSFVALAINKLKASD